MNSSVFNFDSSRPVDLIAMGRVAVDLYAEQIGVSLKDVSSFKKYLGGCAGNIAVGTARLGLNTMMLSCVGQDEMGDFLIQELTAEGVNTELVRVTSEHLTALVLLGIKPPRDFPLMFYRTHCADMQISADQITLAALRTAKALLITGTGLSTALIKETTHAIVRRAREAETSVVFDLDYRPVLWGLTAAGDGESRYLACKQVSATYQDLLPYCDLIVGTEEEVLIAGGDDDLSKSIQRIRELTSAPIVLKLGERGAQVYFANSVQVMQTTSFPVEVLNVLGAGDGFMSGFLAGLLRGESWEVATAYANACGALVVTRHGCAPAIPYKKELDYFIQNYDINPLVWRSSELAALHEQGAGRNPAPALVKNPGGFQDGINSVITQDSRQSQGGMRFTVLKLRMGQHHDFDAHYEFAALLMTGNVIFYYANQQRQAQRYDYFTQNPIVLHGASGLNASIGAVTDCEILLIETNNANQFEPMVFDETNMLELDERGKGILADTSYRVVRTVFDKRNRPKSNLVVGEIITFQGRWSSYPSHYHEQPEIYHYRFSEPQGYAFGEQGKEVLRIEHYDTYFIDKDQDHAHCVAPGYALYTLWCIRHLDNNPYLAPTFRKEHEWTRTAAANQRVWKNAARLGANNED